MPYESTAGRFLLGRSHVHAGFNCLNRRRSSCRRTSGEIRQAQYGRDNTNESGHHPGFLAWHIKALEQLLAQRHNVNNIKCITAMWYEGAFGPTWENAGWGWEYRVSHQTSLGLLLPEAGRSPGHSGICKALQVGNGGNTVLHIDSFRLFHRHTLENRLSTSAQKTGGCNQPHARFDRGLRETATATLKNP